MTTVAYTIEALRGAIDRGEYTLASGADPGPLEGVNNFCNRIFGRYGRIHGEYRRLTNDEAAANISGIGVASRVDQFGGEGQGDDYWLVFSVEDSQGVLRYFMAQGWYSSYSGGEYDTIHEVYPATETITVWKTRQL